MHVTALLVLTYPEAGCNGVEHVSQLTCGITPRLASINQEWHVVHYKVLLKLILEHCMRSLDIVVAL